MPMVLGTIRQYPPYATRPYSELIGRDQDVRMLFCVGYMDMYVDEASIQIGNTPIASFDEVTVELQTLSTDPEITLFKEAVFEQAVNKRIILSNPPTEVTAINTDRIIYEIHFPE